MAEILIHPTLTEQALLTAEVNIMHPDMRARQMATAILMRADLSQLHAEHCLDFLGYMQQLDSSDQPTLLAPPHLQIIPQNYINLKP